MASIEIKNITINVNFNGATASASAKPNNLLDMLMGGLFGNKEAGAGSSAKVLNAADVVEYVKSAEGGKRTLVEIAEHFDDVPEDIITHTMAVLEMMDKVVSEEGDDESVTFSIPAADGAATPAETTEQAAAPAFTPATLVTFLGSDPRYTKRSMAGIQEAFPSVDGDTVTSVVNEALAAGQITTSTRRRDGATLYSAAHVASTDANLTNLIAFLNGDTRYTKRSLGAIAKYFGIGESVAGQLVKDAINKGIVESVYSRRTSAYRYKATVRSYDVPATEAVTESATAGSAVVGLDLTNLRAFLASSEEHSKRTKTAIASHFGVSAESEELGDLLESAVNDGDVELTHRRRDGAPLYNNA